MARQGQFLSQTSAEFSTRSQAFPEEADLIRYRGKRPVASGSRKKVDPVGLPGPRPVGLVGLVWSPWVESDGVWLSLAPSRN
ncbi:uncharacterized protein N7459_004693 [Penicillium hispanicum]|uniref:uncharacterized protein n=1 Tax=Penicillium hispanicum TaxID=1080232 RepID=UPI0025421C4A|nr:uncharacterized protein N7459_004693 [Penicillium hispanicum]KAJ5584893.1 hypothetical protein N7459_004693 [Penicillium hispanicum]